MYWMRSENNRENNREKLHELKELGYKFKIDAYGYQVWFKDTYIHGAGVLGKGRPMHYKHRDANLKRYLFLAVLTAHKHREKNNKQ